MTVEGTSSTSGNSPSVLISSSVENSVPSSSGENSTPSHFDKNDNNHSPDMTIANFCPPWSFMPDYGFGYNCPFPYYQQPRYNQFPQPYFTPPSPFAFPNVPTPFSSAQYKDNPLESDNPFQLKMLNHMMKVCAGCRGGYEKKQDGSLPDPPDDICICHEETITLTEPVSKKPFQKKTKVHYHCRKECVPIKNPNFQLNTLEVPSNVSSNLTNVHWKYLREQFGI